MKTHRYFTTLVVLALLCAFAPIACSKGTPKGETVVSPNTEVTMPLENESHNNDETSDAMTDDDCVAYAQEQEDFEVAFQECLKRYGLDLMGEEEAQDDEDESLPDLDHLPQD